MRYDPPRAGHKAWVSVLREDPALAEGVPAVELPAARRAAVARMWWLEKGPWQPDQIGPGEHGSLGVLVLGGLLLRRVTVHGSPCAELLGPGDVLRPWSVRLEQAASIPVHATFRVLAESRVANLDRDFAVRVARWPEITDGLIERVTDRMRRLSYNLAAQRSRRVDERLWLMLWQLADRWGTVGPYGVELAVPGLSHSVLGSLIAAHRPSVTTAMGRLAARGLIRRFPNGSVLLCGDPSSGAFDQGDDRAAASIKPLRPPEISVEARVTRTCAERLPQQGS